MRKRRFTPVLAWALWAVIVACLGIGIGLASAVGQPDLATVITIVSFFGFATVGALIVAYRPGNTIGWLFLAIGIGTGYTASSDMYVMYSALTGAQLSLAPTLDWLGNVIWPVNIGLGLYVLILFPDGHLLSPRWRPLIWALTLALVASSVSSAFTPGAFSGETTINPYGITALATPLTILGTLSNVLIIPCGLLVVASTLLVVALFNPLRHRIQTVIDQRFYRRKYDADRTLAAFSAMLRTETDLTSLTQRLARAVEETMQPAKISVWLRTTDREVPE